tara:strand:+ start:1239 stop:2018 length:780 start_codon:yes stop_codon:yes gene_type:complete
MSVQTLDSKQTLKKIFEKFQEGERFHFTRFGDGDLYTIFDRNCHAPDSDESALGTISGKYNQFEVTEIFQKELIDAYNIDDENYLVASILNQSEIGIQSHDNTRLLNLMEKRVNEGSIINRKQFLHHFVFIYNFVNEIDYFKKMINQHIKNKKTMYVGDEVSSNFEKVFGEVDYFVKTPSKNSYATIDSWYSEIEKNIDNVDVIFLCSGFSSRVLSKRIWNLQKNVVSLDLGSFISALKLDFNRMWFSGKEQQIINNIG